jgi:hypothetical protein
MAGEGRPVFGPAVPAPRDKQRKIDMFAKITLVAAITVLACVASARADGIDGKPTHPDDRHVPASVRGSPSIIFEDVGALGLVDSCVSGNGYGGADSCGAEGKF